MLTDLQAPVTTPPGMSEGSSQASPSSETPRPTEPIQPRRLGITLAGHVLIVWRVGDDAPLQEGYARAKALPVEAGRLTVLVAADDWTWVELVDLLTAELPRWLNLGYRSIRLFVSGAGGDVGGGAVPARVLAARLGIEVVAPDGEVTGGAGATLVRRDTDLGHWWHFQRGQRPVRGGSRFPTPAWESDLARREAVTIAPVVEEIPAGLWIHDGRGGQEAAASAYLIPVDPNRVVLLVSRPGGAPPSAAEVCRVILGLPRPLWDRVVLVPYGPWPVSDFGSLIAAFLGCQVRALTGLPTPDGARVVAFSSRGTPAWEPLAREVAYPENAGAWAQVVAWSRLPGLTVPDSEVAPVGDGWVAEVIAAGLWIRPTYHTEGALVVRGLPTDPDWCTVILGVVADRATAPSRDVVTRVLGSLPENARRALRIALPAVIHRRTRAWAGVRRLGAGVNPHVLCDDGMLLPVAEFETGPLGRRLSRQPALLRRPLPVFSKDSGTRIPPTPPVPSAPPSPSTVSTPVWTTPPVVSPPVAPAGGNGVAAPPVDTPTAPPIEPAPGEMEKPVQAPVSDPPAEVPPLVAPPVVSDDAPVSLLNNAVASVSPDSGDTPASIPSPSSLASNSPALQPTPDGQSEPPPPQNTAPSPTAPPSPTAAAVPTAMTIPFEAYTAAATADDRELVRTGLGWRYDAYAQRIGALAAERPGMRMTDGSDASQIDLAAVCAYFDDEPMLLGQRDPTGAPNVRLIRAHLACVAAGLRRLPSYPGAVFLAGAGKPMPRPGDMLSNRAFLSATSDLTARFDTRVEWVIWSVSGRRLDGLVPVGRRHEVVFIPGSRFLVLAVIPSAQPEKPTRLLLTELIGAGDTKARLDRVRARLEALAQRRQQTSNGALIKVGEPGWLYAEPDEWMVDDPHKRRSRSE